MSPDARTAFLDRLRRAEASAAGRGLRIVGYRYEVADDRLQFSFRSLKRARREPPVEPPRSRRGVAGTGNPQGALL